MEHRSSASSNDDGGPYPLPGRPHMHVSNPVQYQVPLFQQSVQSFPSGSGALNRGLCTSQSQPPTHKGEPGNAFLSDLNNYIENFSSVDGRLGADSANHVGFGSLLKMGAPLHAPVMSSASPEALLDVISVAQRKLRHLEANVRIMIQGGRQHGITQQHQSLSLEFAYIMSQLFAATSGFQSSSSSAFQALSPAPQLNDGFDFNFDEFNEDFCPPSSGCATLADAPNSAMRGGTEVHVAAGLMDQRTTGMGSTVPSNDAANFFMSLSAHRDITEAKGTPRDPSEPGNNNHAIHDIDTQVLISSEDQKDDDDDGEGESLPPGSYELVELAATEILAEHTHFCEICSKGFKRDANLRMHMRGHGDEYKTPAALARPDKTPRDPLMVKLRRYSCPYAGCKRNKKHQKFQPLKTMLCVKNHYRRSHCPKLLICSRCKTKKFSVVADLKTHEKHCGQDKWQCSCGTTFSRKDKLFGHIGLFAGHTPATPMHETERVGSGVEASSGDFFSEFGENMEGLGSNKADSLGMAGTSANLIQDNVAAANYATVSHRIDALDVTAAMGTKALKNDGNNEQSAAHGDKNLPFVNVTNGAMTRGASYPSAILGRVSSDGSELNNLLSDSFFHQVNSMN
eukprot:c19898_g1_i1 orf=102-1976(+)